MYNNRSNGGNDLLRVVQKILENYGINIPKDKLQKIVKALLMIIAVILHTNSSGKICINNYLRAVKTKRSKYYLYTVEINKKYLEKKENEDGDLCDVLLDMVGTDEELVELKDMLTGYYKDLAKYSINRQNVLDNLDD